MNDVTHCHINRFQQAPMSVCQGDVVVPYQHCLDTEASQRNVYLYLAGLLSHLNCKAVHS